jgi:prepilin-type N-terminal cleavage/methylation domain-containing protein
VRGFSLIEVLIGLLLSTIIVFALYAVLSSQDRVYSLQDDIGEMQQNLRVAIEKISRDISMAGFGKPAWSNVNDASLSSWYNVGNGYRAIKPVSGSGTTLDILGCLDAASGKLSASVTAGETNIVLQPGEGPHFNASPGTKSDISIGGYENAKIIGISGDILTIDTDPVASGNQGLANNYAGGTEVYTVRWLTYSTGTSDGVPVFRINENRGSGNQPLCQYITGMSVSVNGSIVDLTLNARTRNPDRTTGQYITASMDTRIVLRNP